eukprot:TRINITY_DN78542_c0_g1_i1.p1 TRINITY_DN78542_c0_g1~~TRINITY_DN78542_c0_g1_i1.p1  ORF type:complete len:300 (-),score=55.33 TRINITY_DN78542_c0_g1_i1:113-1012(-)
MLLEFPSRGPLDLEKWWRLFHRMIERPGSSVAATSLFLQAQAFEQSGRRFPYVPLLGLHAAKAGRAKGTAQRPEVLLHRLEWMAQIAYGRLLEALLEQWKSEGRIPADFRFESLTAERQLRFEEMVEFKALVIFPKQPHEVKLADAFAQQMVIFIPSEPLVHRFLWPFAKPFGFYIQDPIMRQVLHSKSPWSGSPEVVEGGSPTSVGRLPDELGFDNGCQAERFWWPWTEWAMLLEGGVQGFQSAAELLQRLSLLDTSEVLRIQGLMHKTQLARKQRALRWWRQAAAASLWHGRSLSSH